MNKIKMKQTLKEPKRLILMDAASFSFDFIYWQLKQSKYLFGISIT